ncbi:basic leucine zipper transcriptional factor atf-like 3, partial [Plakobranchus ocellatus]
MPATCIRTGHRHFVQMESSCDLDKFLKLLMMESQVANEESEQQQQQDQNQQLQNEQQELRQRDISEKLLKNAKQDHWILQHDGLTLKPRLQQDNIATYAIQSQMPLVKLEPPETPPTPETPPSPDTKSVLKATIQRRRRATGQGDFENLFTEKEPCQLTEEDVMKRERRRQQNRVSARTFRTKKKLLQENAKK